MESKTFVVPAINCGHCVRRVQDEISGVQGVRSVSADRETQQVTVEWDNPATWAAIEQALVEINYPPAAN